MDVLVEVRNIQITCVGRRERLVSSKQGGLQVTTEVVFYNLINLPVKMTGFFFSSSFK